MSFAAKIDLDRNHNKVKHFLFSDSFLDYQEKYLYAKFTRENRRNDVNLKACHPSLLKQAFRSDMMYGAKVGVKWAENYDEEMITKCFVGHSSFKYLTNFSDLKHFKLKSFVRYIKTF